MKKKEISYLEISDIHLGHHKNKTEEIVANLTEFFSDFKSESSFTKLDYIFIAGDLFDRLLDLASKEFHEIMHFLARLMYFCQRHDISLRVLEGTPSHDWKQSRITSTLNEILEIDIDFKYIDTLHIEYHEKNGIWILYVPDEWTDNTDVTFSQVQQLLKEHGIQQVDIAMMHGLFQYQLQNVVGGNIQKHKESDYLSIVKHFINIGHIHTFSNYQRIIASGSFDRLSHGEEELKGGVLCTIREDGDDEFVFVQNKKAKIFKTISIRHQDLDVCYSQIDKVLSKIPINSHIRIKAKKDHPIYSALEQFKVRYPLYYFTKKSEEEAEEDRHLLVSTDISSDLEYTPITITPDNIVTMIMSEVCSKYQISERQEYLLTSLLVSNNA